MKKYFMSLIMLAFISCIAIAQPELPTQEIWSCNIDRAPTAWSQYWLDENGEVNCLVGLGNRAVLVQSGEITWESPELNGNITALCRADFGLEDGPRMLAAVLTDSTGEIWEFFGEGWEESIHHTPEHFYRTDEFTPRGNNITDTRVIKVILALPIIGVDSIRTVFMSNDISNQHVGMSGVIQSTGGTSMKYSLRDDDSLSMCNSGAISDFSLTDMDGDGVLSLFQAGNSGSSGNWPGDGSSFSVVNEYNTDLEVESSIQMNIGGCWNGMVTDNYFGVYPATENYESKLVNIGWEWQNEIGELGGTSQTYYWSEYPYGGHCTILDSIEREDFIAIRVVEHEDAETGARYALLMEDGGRVRVLDVDEEIIVGDLMFEQGVLLTSPLNTGHSNSVRIAPFLL